MEVWTKGGLVTFYLLLVIKLSDRRVHFAGCTPNPHDAWIKQVAKNLTEPLDGFLGPGGYVLMDRDSKYSESFRHVLQGEHIRVLRLPARSPNLNAYIERFMRSLKEECLERLIFFGEGALRKAVQEFLGHYHTERKHHGLDNRVINAGEEVGRAAGKIECRQRLGGLLRYYYRDAA